MADSNSASSSEQGKMGNGNEPAANKEQIINMVTSEMEYRVELFNRLTHTCFDKCVEKRYKEGELHIGENSCIDRCVSKYWQTNCMVRKNEQKAIAKDAGFERNKVNNIIGQILGSGRPTM